MKLKILKFKMYGIVVIGFVSLFLFLFFFGDLIGRAMSTQLASINHRVHRKKSTSFDKVQCQLFYTTIIYVGGLAYPEAAAILHHYINGKGEVLHLDPGYIKNSPVVRLAVKKMKIGEKRTVRFKQNKDWRLSYAVNGFMLRRSLNKVTLSQKIIFSKDARIVTDLNFFLFKVRVPDGLVHALDPTSFMVYSEWEVERSPIQVQPLDEPEWGFLPRILSFSTRSTP